MPRDIVADLLISALECVQHFIVMQLLPQLRRNLQDSLFGKIFYEIFDKEALKWMGGTATLTGEKGGNP